MQAAGLCPRRRLQRGDTVNSNMQTRILIAETSMTTGDFARLSRLARRRRNQNLRGVQRSSNTYPAQNTRAITDFDQAIGETARGGVFQSRLPRQAAELCPRHRRRTRGDPAEPAIWAGYINRAELYERLGDDPGAADRQRPRLLGRTPMQRELALSRDVYPLELQCLHGRKGHCLLPIRLVSRMQVRRIGLALVVAEFAISGFDRDASLPVV